MRDRQYISTKDIEQSRTLWERGVLLLEKSDGYEKKMLYQMYDLYIEVTWHTHFNVIKKVRTFTSTNDIEPFLEEIDIKSLID